MIQDPNPTDDPQMEQFCEWLYTEGYANQMTLEKLREVWLRGRCDYYGARIANGEYPGTPDGSGKETYELLMYLFRKATEQLQKHLAAYEAAQ